MAPVERSTVANATPETIWKACFEEMKFETWDPDVTELVDVSGGCENGTTFTFVMKDGGTKIPQTLSGVKKNESLTFSGTFYGSNILGIITLTPVEGSDKTKTKTKVAYSFDMDGCVGSIIKTFRSEYITGGTEMGLANIVRLSEEAQQKQ